MSRADSVALDAEGWTCIVAPDQGGAILRLAYRGVDVLRPTAADATHPFQFSSFVMAPYANRIANGRFSWAGEEIVIPANIDGEKHPLHGVAFATPCKVTRDASMLTLSSKHEASPAWPWAFELTQTLRATANVFRHDVELRNTSRTTAPGGLGFHPYFAPATGARLTANVDGMWIRDTEQLPSHHQAERDFWRSASLRSAETLDNCFTGWDGRALMRWESGEALEITASDNLMHLHIYTPTDGDFFCLEPVTHRPNAINGYANERGAMRALQPGETMSAWMRLAHVKGEAR